MKRYLRLSAMPIIFIFTVFLSTVFAGEVSSDPEYADVKGGFTKRTGYLYIAYGTEMERKIKVSLAKYDSLGRKIELIAYSWDGSLKHRFTYDYDIKGNKIKEVFYHKDGRIISTTIFKYDSHGNKIERIKSTRHGSDQIEKFSYEYDSQGNKIERTDYNNAGDVQDRYLYKYDKQNNLTEYTMRFSNGSVLEKIDSKYDSNGNLIESQSYSHGKYSGKSIHEYDDDSRLIKSILYNSDGSVNHTNTYKYDEFGNLVENSLDGGMTKYIYSN